MKSRDLELMLKAFSDKMGRIKFEWHSDYYADSFRASIKCEITNAAYSFVTPLGFDEKYVSLHLSHAEDAILKERGKHLMKSYKFYDDKAYINSYDDLGKAFEKSAKSIKNLDEVMNKLEKQRRYEENKDFGTF